MIARSFIVGLAIYAAAHPSRLVSQGASDSLVARATAEGIAAAEVQPIGLYPATAFLGGGLVGFFGPVALNGSPLGIVALAGVSTMIFSSSTAAKDSGILPDSIRLRISKENTDYREAFARSYERRLNARRQQYVFLFGALGMGAGIVALIQLITSGT